MEPQLYMWSGVRRIILERHDTYVEAVKTRVISQFIDVEAQADSFANETYRKMVERPAREDDVDMSELAEAAHEAGLERYELLCFLKREMLLGSLAGLFHVWDRSLRDFLEGEFRHWMEAERITKFAWRDNFDGILKTLAEFGWDVAGEPFFKDLDACRLIVNVYKHGKGTSLDDLSAKYPQFLKYHSRPELSFLARHLDHEDLEITGDQFSDIAASLRAFWVAFPERSFPPHR